jgi:hypothetical protein
MVRAFRTRRTRAETETEIVTADVIGVARETGDDLTIDDATTGGVTIGDAMIVVATIGDREATTIGRHHVNQRTPVLKSRRKEMLQKRT